MRKIGIEIFYWIDNWTDDQAGYFERAKSCGYDGVEIDLLARRGATVVFVEVKTRTSERHGPPEAGLDKKRNRRTYTGSFVDLDDDDDLDLLVVSDFAGVDAYENNGKGVFKDITSTFVDERHLFGMSATFGDYNLDGRLDFISWTIPRQGVD